MLADIEVPTDSWPMSEFGTHMRIAALGTRVTALLEHADGVHTAMDWRRWCSRPDDADRSVLTRVTGTTLDVGCGPGRLTVTLAARGHAVLGIDVTPDAVSLTRAAGGVALHRSVFSHIPGEGRWETVLLIDGNIGIGGDPIALLRRVRQLLAPTGRALIELEPPATVGHIGPARIRRVDGVVTSWFPWARVPGRHDRWRRRCGRLGDPRVLGRRWAVVRCARTGGAVMNLRVLTKPLPTPPGFLRQGPLRAGFFRSRLRSIALTARIGTLLGACLTRCVHHRDSRATWPSTHNGDCRFRPDRSRCTASLKGSTSRSVSPAFLCCC